MAKPLVNKALAVGLLVGISGLAFLVAFTFFKKGGYSEKESYRVYAYFTDATGLTWKSRVQIAGIQIGEVEQVSLVGSRARLDLRIQNGIQLRKDACLTKRFPSTLLPDALLEAVPGTAQAPLLQDLPESDREIACVNEATSIEKLLDTLTDVATDIQSLTGELSGAVSGQQGSIKRIIENLTRVSDQIARTVEDQGHTLNAILVNAESFTGTLAEVAEKDRDRYRSIARNVDQASGQLVQVLDTVQGIMGKNQPELEESVEGVRHALAKLNRSLDEVEKVAVSIGEGKGIAGKLLADEQLGNKVENTVEVVSDYVDRVNRLQLEVSLRSEWLLNQSTSKTYAGVKLIPRPDKYYLFEIISDPRGVKTVETQEVQRVVDGVPSTTVERRVITEDDVTFSLQLARRYGAVTFRGGMIESSGGAGMDVHLLDDRLTISANVFQFTRSDPDLLPRLKVWANFNFFRYLFITAGADDLLENWQTLGRLPGGGRDLVGQDVLFGGGVAFTDDDLKTILGVAGGGVTTVTSQ
jgi:phospholipid/cholesterol/gamma-HCH transport system substrate-binding protein